MFLELGIFISQGIWLWRVRHVRREAKKAGKTYDEYLAENPSKKLARSESTDTVSDLEAFQTDTETKETVTPLEKCTTKPSKEPFDMSMTEVVIPDTQTSNLRQYPVETATPAGRD